MAIDILIAIDANAIVEKHTLSTDPNNPTSVDDNHIFMITTQDDVVKGQAGQELNVQAEIGDTIRWRETSLSMNLAYDVLFYEFDSNNQNLIAPVQALTAVKKVAIPNDQDLLHPAFKDQENYFWNTTALGTGEVTYHFKFMVIDKSGKVIGYCQWDPFITINN